MVGGPCDDGREGPALLNNSGRGRFLTLEFYYCWLASVRIFFYECAARATIDYFGSNDFHSVAYILLPIAGAREAVFVILFLHFCIADEYSVFTLVRIIIQRTYSLPRRGRRNSCFFSLYGRNETFTRSLIFARARETKSPQL